MQVLPAGHSLTSELLILPRGHHRGAGARSLPEPQAFRLVLFERAKPKVRKCYEESGKIQCLGVSQIFLRSFDDYQSNMPVQLGFTVPAES